MSWNEPGNNDRDPWGGGKRNNNEGPPDLDELIRKFQGKLGAVFGGGQGGSSSQGGNGFLFTAIIGLIVLLLIYSAVYTLNEQERGVVLRLGEYSRTETPGLHFKIPLADRVIPVNVTNVRNAGMKELMLTRDENIVEVEMNVQYLVSDPVMFALRVEDPAQTLEHAAESALRHEVGSTDLDQILTVGRAEMSALTKVRIQDYMERYQTGIEVREVNIKEARAPVAVQAAFDDVQKAKLDKERYVNEAEAYRNTVVPEARGKAQRMLEAANGYKEEVIARAEGEADRFVNLLEEYEKAPQVTRERLYLDAVSSVYSNTSKVLVDSEGGNNMLYLPLDQLKRAPDAAGRINLDDTDLSIIADQVINRLRDRQPMDTPRRGGGR